MPRLTGRLRPPARFLAVALVLVVLLTGETLRTEAVAEQAARAFVVEINGIRVPHPVFAAFVLPGGTVTLDAGGAATRVRAASVSGDLVETLPGRWRWRAPDQPGLYRLTMAQAEPRAEIHINAFVMVPATAVRNGMLNGYRIDPYPQVRFRGLDAYRPPAGFVEVTPDNADTLVSPHFRLGQFLCRQAGGFPKYVVLQPSLLLKLEAILAAVNARGFAADSLHVMSGYRTPFYNRGLGNGANSRHIYGDAADVFVDANPRDGRMDDLDRDGRITTGDTQVLYDLIERTIRTSGVRSLIGGLSAYPATRTHGPFVHVDARGYRARW